MSHRQRERGAAVPEFVLVLILLIPVVWGIAHLMLVLHVRNTITAAASDGARAAAVMEASTADAEQRARTVVSTTLAEEMAQDIAVSRSRVGGVSVIEVAITAHVPAFVIGGAGTKVSAVGHAVLQETP